MYQSTLAAISEQWVLEGNKWYPAVFIKQYRSDNKCEHPELKINLVSQIPPPSENHLAGVQGISWMVMNEKGMDKEWEING